MLFQAVALRHAHTHLPGYSTHPSSLISPLHLSTHTNEMPRRSNSCEVSLSQVIFNQCSTNKSALPKENMEVVPNAVMDLANMQKASDLLS